jgi:hypothetical protein
MVTNMTWPLLLRQQWRFNIDDILAFNALYLKRTFLKKMPGYSIVYFSKHFLVVSVETACEKGSGYKNDFFHCHNLEHTSLQSSVEAQRIAGSGYEIVSVTKKLWKSVEPRDLPEGWHTLTNFRLYSSINQT